MTKSIKNDTEFLKDCRMKRVYIWIFVKGPDCGFCCLGGMERCDYHLKTHWCRTLYPTLSQFWLCRHAVLSSVMAAAGEDAPLVASESGADWQVLENAMTPQEVHTKRKVVRLHSFPFRFAVSTIHLTDAPFLRGAWNIIERVK